VLTYILELELELYGQTSIQIQQLGSEPNISHSSPTHSPQNSQRYNLWPTNITIYRPTNITIYSLISLLQALTVTLIEISQNT
jgi:hypothetical protein